MELDLTAYEEQTKLNEIARVRYERLVKMEKELKNSPNSRRITQEKMGKQIGLSGSMISFWLKNERQLSTDAAKRLLDVILNEEALLKLRKEREQKLAQEIEKLKAEYNAGE